MTALATQLATGLTDEEVFGRPAQTGYAPGGLTDEEVFAPEKPNATDDWNRLDRRVRIALTLDTFVRQERDKGWGLTGIAESWAQQLPLVRMAARPLLYADTADLTARVGSATGGPLDKLPAHEEEAYRRLARRIVDDERQQTYEARLTRPERAINWAGGVVGNLAASVAEIESFIGLGGAVVGTAVAGPVAFEAESQILGRAGGETPTPGIGVLQWAGLKVFGRGLERGAGVGEKVARTGAEMVLFGSMAASEGAKPEDIIVQALIPAAFAGYREVRQNYAAKLRNAATNDRMGIVAEMQKVAAERAPAVPTETTQKAVEFVQDSPEAARQWLMEVITKPDGPSRNDWPGELKTKASRAERDTFMREVAKQLGGELQSYFESGGTVAERDLGVLTREPLTPTEVAGLGGPTREAELSALSMPDLRKLAVPLEVKTGGRSKEWIAAQIIAKEQTRAVQEQKAGTVLQRPPEGAGSSGGERGRVERGIEGAAPAPPQQEGQGPRPEAAGQPPVDTLDAAVGDLWRYMNTRTSANAPLDPEMYALGAKIVGAAASRGMRKFDDFLSRMNDRMGTDRLATMAPYLRQSWDLVRAGNPHWELGGSTDPVPLLRELPRRGTPPLAERPDRLTPASTPESAEALNTVRQLREIAGRTPEPEAVTEYKAKSMLQQNPDLVLRRMAQAATGQNLLNNVEMRAGLEMRNSWVGKLGGPVEDLARAVRVNDLYEAAGSESGKALQARIEPWTGKVVLRKTILDLPEHLESKINVLRERVKAVQAGAHNRPTTEEENASLADLHGRMNKVYDEWAKAVDGARKRLEPLGIDFANIEQYAGTKAGFRIMAEMRPLKRVAWDKTMEFARSNLLGWLAYQAQLFGQTLNFGLQMADQRINAGIKRLLVGINPAWEEHFAPSGKVHIPSKPEFEARSLQIWTEALAEAWHVMMDSIRWEVPMYRNAPGLEKAVNPDYVGGAIGGKLGRVIRAWGLTPFWSFDIFQSQMIYRVASKSRAVGMAFEEGLTGQVATRRAEELCRDPQSPVHDYAIKAVQEALAKQKGGAAAQAVVAVGQRIAKTPVFGLMAIFPNTPVKLAEQLWRRLPVTGFPKLYSEITYARRTGDWTSAADQGMKQIVATGAVAALAAFIDPDDPWITGAVHPDYPNTIRFLGQRLSYNYVQPFTGLVAALVDTATQVRRGNFGEAALTPFKSLVKQAGDSFMLTGVVDFVRFVRDVATNPTQEGTFQGRTLAPFLNWISKFPATFVPMSSNVRAYGRAQRGQVPEWKVWGEGEELGKRGALRAWQRMELDPLGNYPRRNFWGEAQQTPASPFHDGALSDFLWRTFSRAGFQTITKPFIGDEVIAAWTRLHPEDPQTWREWPRTYVVHGGKRVDLTDPQYDKYVAESGQLAKQMIQRAFDRHPDLKAEAEAGNPTQPMIDTMAKIVSDSRSAIALRIMREMVRNPTRPAEQNLAPDWVRKRLQSQPAPTR